MDTVHMGTVLLLMVFITIFTQEVRVLVRATVVEVEGARDI